MKIIPNKAFFYLFYFLNYIFTEQEKAESKNDSIISTSSEEENNSGGNTSEDITSLPFVSENVINSTNNGLNQVANLFFLFNVRLISLMS